VDERILVLEPERILPDHVDARALHGPVGPVRDADPNRAPGLGHDRRRLLVRRTGTRRRRGLAGLRRPFASVFFGPGEPERDAHRTGQRDQQQHGHDHPSLRFHRHDSRECARDRRGPFRKGEGKQREGPRRAVVPGVEARPQLVEAALEARAYGAAGNAEQRRDLLRRAVLVEPQQHGLAVRLLEREHGVDDLPVPGEPLGGAGVRLGPRRALLAPAAPFPVPQRAVREIAHDAPEPGARAARPGRVAHRREHRLLHDVVARVGVVDEPAGQHLHERPVLEQRLGIPRASTHRSPDGVPAHGPSVARIRRGLQRGVLLGKHGDVTADREFLRFARDRDPDALAAVFDATAPGLLRLAMHLTGEPAEAEDLVQTTFLAAIESARSYDGARPVRRWLAGILANKARLRFRDRARRPDPHRLPRREPRRPDEAAAHRELDAEVDRALNRLEDPYRETLVLHLRYGLQPAEIADALGRSAVAVRTHLHRGRAMLRRLLPAGLLAGLLGAAATPRGLHAVRKTVLGGLVMKKKLGLAALLVALLAVSGIVWQGQEAGDGDVSSARPLRADASVEKTAPLPNPGNDAGSVATKPEATTGTLRVRVVAKGTDEEIPHAVVTLFPHTPLRSGAVLALPPGKYRLGFGSRARSVRVDAGRQSIAVLELAEGLTVRGTVVDREDRPVPHAELHLSPPLKPWSAVPVGRADENGAFFFRRVRSGATVCARAGHRGSSDGVSVIGSHGHETTVRLVVSGRGGAVAGAVVGPDGPLPGALVAVDHQALRGSGRDAWGNIVVRHPPTFVLHADDQGRFAARGIDEGEVVVTAAAPGLAPAQTTVTVQHGSTTGLTVRLDRGRVVEGRVTKPDGQPAAGAAVTLQIRVPFAERSAETADDGRFRLEHLARGRYTAYIRHEAGKAKLDVDEPFLAIQLEPRNAVHGRVVDQRGRPLSRWHVKATGNDSVRGVTKQDGRFVLRDVESPCDITLFEKGFTFPTLVVRNVEPGAEEIRIEVPEKRRNTAWIEGRIEGARNAKLSMTRTDGRDSESWPVDAGFRIGPFPAGRYDLEIRIPGQAPALRRKQVLRAGETLDLGTVHGSRAGRLRIRIGLATGKVVQLKRDGGTYDYYTVDDGRVDPGPLAPGRYRIKVEQPGHAQVLEDVTVVADRTETVELELRPGALRRLRFHPPAGTKSIAVRVFGPGDRLVAEFEDDEAPFVRPLLLGSGVHVVEAAADGGRVIRREVEAGDGPIAIRW